MPPRPNLEPGDLVTPTRFGQETGHDPNKVRVWIHRSEQLIGRKVEPLGQLGRWPAYDFNDLADLEREMHRRRQQREATAQAA